MCTTCSWRWRRGGGRPQSDDDDDDDDATCALYAAIAMMAGKFTQLQFDSYIASHYITLHSIPLHRQVHAAPVRPRRRPHAARRLALRDVSQGRAWHGMEWNGMESDRALRGVSHVMSWHVMAWMENRIARAARRESCHVQGSAASNGPERNSEFRRQAPNQPRPKANRQKTSRRCEYHHTRVSQKSLQTKRCRGWRDVRMGRLVQN